MSTQYFGRAFKVTVHSTATGEDWVVSNSTWGNEALKVTFAIEQQANSAWFAADVVLWNFDPAASQVIQKGDLITVEAGYQSPGSGVIFSGRIFQTLSERVSQTDNALTLHCLFGQWEDENGYVSVQFSKGYTQDQAVRLVASQAGIAVAYLDPALAANPYLKGQSFAGIARRFFDQVARSNHLHTWIAPNGLYISSLTSDATSPDVVYAPPYSSAANTNSQGGVTKYTLIGSPEQTELGVTFRVLLDSNIKLGTLVGLRNVVTKRLPQQPNQFQAAFSKDGVYSIAGFRHLGDTRGNEWYTEVTGLYANWDKIRQSLYQK